MQNQRVIAEAKNKAELDLSNFTTKSKVKRKTHVLMHQNVPNRLPKST